MLFPIKVVLLYYQHCFGVKGGSIGLLKYEIARVGCISLKRALHPNIMSKVVGWILNCKELQNGMKATIFI